MYVCVCVFTGKQPKAQQLFVFIVYFTLFYCVLFVIKIFLCAFCKIRHLLLLFFLFQDPAGIFELVEVVGNGTYGQVYKVIVCLFIKSTRI